MVHFILLTLLAFLCLPVPAQAQVSEQEVLLSGDYIFGQAYGETRDEAVSNARVALIERLVVTVASEAELTERDDADTFESTFVSRTQTLSRMQLRGLDVLTNERRDGSWAAIAFISNDDYARSMEIERERLVRLLRTAEQNRGRSRSVEALRNYAEVLVQRPFFPLPLYTDEAIEDGPGNDVAEYASRSIEELLSDTHIEIQELLTYTDPEEIVLELALRYEEGRGQPVQEMEVRFDLAGYGYVPVSNGHVRLSLDVLPDRPLASYAVELRPVYTPSDETQRATAEAVLPSVTRRLEVDFRPHIRLDFSATPVGTGGYQFRPSIQNLAVQQVEWDFGDGLSSAQLNPRQAFTEAQMQEPRLIILTLNQREELRVKKELHPDGSLRKVREPAAAAPRPYPRPAPTPAPSPEPAAYVMPPSHQPMMDELLRSETWDQAQRLLSGHQQPGFAFGNSDAVGSRNTSRSYVLIINPQSRRIEAVLTPEFSGKRQNLRNEELIENVRERFSGRAPIWVLLP